MSFPEQDKEIGGGSGIGLEYASRWRATAPLRPNSGPGPLKPVSVSPDVSGGPAPLLFTASRRRVLSGVRGRGAAGTARP